MSISRSYAMSWASDAFAPQISLRRRSCASGFSANVCNTLERALDVVSVPAKMKVLSEM